MLEARISVQQARSNRRAVCFG